MVVVVQLVLVDTAGEGRTVEALVISPVIVAEVAETTVLVTVTVFFAVDVLATVAVIVAVWPGSEGLEAAVVPGTVTVAVKVAVVVTVLVVTITTEVMLVE